MKHTLCVIVFLIAWVSQMNAQRPNLQLGIQVGINSTLMRAKLEVIEEIFDEGYQGGVYFRVTKRRVFGQIGINFIRSTAFGSEEELNNDPDLTDNLRVFNTEIPLLVGYKPVKEPLIKWRVYNGLNVLWTGKVLNADKAGLGITKEDFREPHFGYRLGTGIDFAFFTFDMHYTVGITNALKANFRTQTHFWVFAGGVVF